MTFYEKEPPHDTEAEQALLGVMMISEEWRIKILSQVNLEDFFRPQHQIIFRIMHALHYDKKPLDTLIVTSTLKSYNRLDEIGGAPYILAIFESVTTLAHTSHYIKLVLEASSRRKMLSAFQASIENINNQDVPLENLIQSNKSLLDEIKLNSADRKFKKVGDVLNDSIQQIEENSKRSGGVTGLKTGFDQLDFITSGLQKNDLIILAARPAMGKTSLALNIAVNTAKLNNINVAIFSLEMGATQLTNKMISSYSGVNSYKIRTGKIEAKGWQQVKIAKDSLSQLGIYIDDSPGIDIAKLRSKCVSLHSEAPLGLIVVDYLQLIRGTGYGANRINEVSEVSRTLKEIARELEVPVITLSQLNRAVEGRENKRPIMSDLRESGSIEQDADIIAMMYREDYYRKPSDAKDGKVEILFRKHRNGSTGAFKLDFDAEHSLFRNIYDERTS